MSAELETVPTYHPQEWDDGRFSIQHWLERTAWKNLKDSKYGVLSELPPPHPALYEDPLMAQVYKLDLGTFIAAERVSVECVSSLLRYAPDEASMSHLATQTMDEARHYEVFCRRMADFGVAPGRRDEIVRRSITPPMRKFFDLILEQTDKRDFLAATLALNIILEGMAYPVYRYEKAYWSRLDPGLSEVINGAFQDEVAHVGFGEAYLRTLGKDPGARNKLTRLAREFHVLMMEVFNGVVVRYIGLYQSAANNHMDLMGGIEIFPGKRMCEVTEEEQVQILMNGVSHEYERRMRNIGLPID